MELSDLQYAPGSRKQRKRVGRGIGSGHGGTSTRGHKGQHSRSGSKKRAWFEGGQMPLQRRIPKRGFTNIFRTEYQVVNVQALAALAQYHPITPAVLLKSRLIRKKQQLVKILGEGELDRAVEVHAHSFSKSAIQKIEQAGGKAVVITAPAPQSASK